MPLSGIENILATEKKINTIKKKKIMETAFKKKVAIITGGSSGIGRATALAFKKGKIVIVDWHESPELCRVLQT
jgi:short-subunit dehydrogenase involved in D-alanine esterification of teichoic acids